MGEVIDMSEWRKAREPDVDENLSCPNCGGQWWMTSVVISRKRNNRVTGYAWPLLCQDCGNEYGPDDLSDV